ncbi:MAG: DUF2334 domain-containing protein [Clostridium sp.]|uniref:DUF2334 domain-containing protein n=1 Tax=Clostridium sp. TaxID=1506 RepID=UPI002906DC7F|nr:DUF2334 domain-containing protein [Clostridium sp.]MDU5111268.1 DUF2334 domain-containing protein [Clostridium sp.]
MKKNIKFYSIIITVTIVVSFFNLPAYRIYGVSHNYDTTRGQEFLRKINDDDKKVNHIKKVPYVVSLFFKNSKMNFKNNVLYRDNRLYISISDFIKYFGVAEKVDDNNIEIGKVANINLEEKAFYKNNNKILLRGDIFEENGEYYISIFDLCEILDLNTYWDYENNRIYISNKASSKTQEKIHEDKKKKGYIRFEDFTAGDVYLSQSALEKVRRVADYMNENEESFSVSWIPRYINNSYKIDNDISKEESMENSNFIFTLDYLVNRGGNIGLHGYTHQYNDTDSIIGGEFGDDNCKDPEEIRGRVESALNIANNTNIPISYWETPHYQTTESQQKIFEEYFKIIYEPAIGIYNKKIITSKNNNITKYIPTPLSYVEDDTGEGMLSRIRENKNQEFSLFYHLSIEIKSIEVYIDNNGEIIYKYDDNSILKKIVSLSNELGYRFNDINGM